MKKLLMFIIFITFSLNGMEPFRRIKRNLETFKKMFFEVGGCENQKKLVNQALLFWMCDRKTKLDEIKFLVEQGADVNVFDSFGYNPLYWAALHNDVEKVKLLISAGATAFSAPGSNCVLSAIDSRTSLEITKSVLELESLKKCDDNRGLWAYRILCRLILQRDNEKVKDLVEYLNNEGLSLKKFEGGSGCSSLLHCAIRNDNTTVIPYLLETGCSTDAKDEDGCTPLQLARLNSNTKAISILSEFKMQ